MEAGGGTGVSLTGCSVCSGVSEFVVNSDCSGIADGKGDETRCATGGTGSAKAGGVETGGVGGAVTGGAGGVAAGGTVTGGVGGAATGGAGGVAAGGTVTGGVDTTFRGAGGGGAGDEVKFVGSWRTEVFPGRLGRTLGRGLATGLAGVFVVGGCFTEGDDGGVWIPFPCGPLVPFAPKCATEFRDERGGGGAPSGVELTLVPFGLFSGSLGLLPGSFCLWYIRARYVSTPRSICPLISVLSNMGGIPICEEIREKACRKFSSDFPFSTVLNSIDDGKRACRIAQNPIPSAKDVLKLSNVQLCFEVSF